MAFAAVYLVRHGNTDWASVDDGYLRGHGKDFAPLTAVGVQEAEAAAEELANIGAVTLLCSPMTRAMQTATVIALRTSLMPSVELGLREWSPSRLQQWTRADDAVEAAREMWKHGGEWPLDESRDWERVSTVRRRVLDVLARHRCTGPIIAVTHGVVIESLLGRIADTGEICRWDWTPTWLERWPDADDAAELVT